MCAVIPVIQGLALRCFVESPRTGGTRYKVQVQGTRHTVLGTRCTEYPWTCSLILWGCSKLALLITPIFQSPRRTEAQRPSIHVATLKYRGLSRFTRWLSRRQPTLKTSTQVFQGLAALFARRVSFRRPPGSHGWPTKYQGRFFRLAGLKRQPSAPCRLNSMLSSAKR